MSSDNLYNSIISTIKDSYSIFDETPVSLDDFLYSADFLNIRKLSELQYDFIKHGTNIYYDAEIKNLNWPNIRRVGELVAQFGKGSGKDFCSGIIFARIAYQLLCLSNPQIYYNQDATSNIDMLNMAYNEDQAQSVFFKQFANRLIACKWFSNKCNIKKESIEFSKHIYAYSGNSFDEAFEGKNLIVCVLDEISAFKTKMEVQQLSMRRVRAPRYSADSVYDMAKSSVESRFGNGIGKVISLSFPRFKNDYIQQLYEKGKNDISTYASFGATWDVNPNKKKSDFDSEFRKNPERANARYACQPSSVEDGYFRYKDKLLIAFPIISYDLVPTTYDRFPTLKDWFRATHNYQCAIHIDLALSKDKAGICMSHVCDIIHDKQINDNNESVIIDKPVVKIDFATSFIAPVDGEIDFATIRQLIIELINRGFKIGSITLDQYQSADMIQILSKFGLECEKLSVDKDTVAYDTMKELIYDGRLIGYSYIREIDSPSGIISTNELIDELNSLMLINGKKVDHTAYSSKDISDAVAGSVFGAIQIGLSFFNVNDINSINDKISNQYEESVTGNDYSAVNETDSELAYFT